MADDTNQHDHDHGPGVVPPPLTPTAPAPDDLDPANASLSDAMRLLFVILKVAMVVFIVLFVFSGVFEVKEGQQVGVRVHLGRIHGPPGEQVLGAGWHFAWPQPIDHVLLVPIKTQSLAIDDAFWFQERPNEQTLALDAKTKASQLAPGTDGSLITGDRNIVHGKFTIDYQVLAKDEAHVLQFIRNISADPDPDHMLQAAQAVVRAAAERGMVRLAAEVEAERLLNENLGPMLARYTQEYLDDIESGITITGVQMGKFTAPLIVRDAFNAVTTNENERARLIDAARKEKSTTLIGAAGAAYPAVLLAIDAYEAARLTDDAARIARTESVIDALLDGKPSRQALAVLADDPAVDPADLRDALTDATVGGEVQRLIEEAKAYETAVVQDTQGEVARFMGNLEQFRKTPRIVLNTLWQDARQEILSSPDIETFYLPQNPGKNLYIDINRDPDIRRQRETERYTAPK